LRPLLVVQFLLLAGFLSVGVAAGPHLDPRAGQAVVAGMLGVCAMALQNALVQISVAGAPSTVVITANITRFVMDAGEALMGRDPSQVEEARRRAAHTWPAIVGFAAGAALGAAGFAAAGLTALALPTALAVLALALTPDRSGSKGGSMALRLPRAHGQGATLHGSLSSLAQDEGDDLLSHHANE
jgi:uncharacterized membrane protein YoaK (UPF0700 family)